MVKGSVRVLGIVGSPRRGGNTEILIDEVLRGSSDAGALTEKVLLSELQIHPCDACDACLKSSECAAPDDMEPLLDKMRASQVWVLGTPVYWWGPTAQFKAFLDRWYGLHGKARDMFRGRRIIAVVPYESSDAGVGRHVVGMFEDALDYLSADLFARVIAPGVYDAGAVRNKPDLMAAAYRAGRTAVEG